jgi:hypothetical protein
MYTFAQQSLDNHITGNWGEDDCAPEPVDEVKAITEQLSSFINILIVDGDDNFSQGYKKQGPLENGNSWPCG